MARRRQPPPADVVALARRVERWRAEHPPRSHLPKDLWAGAISLARIHGPYSVARDVRVRYETLKDRLEQAVTAEVDEPASGEPFIELAPSQLLGPVAEQHLVVEVERRDGTRLTVRLPKSTPLDVVALAQAVLGTRRGP